MKNIAIIGCGNISGIYFKNLTGLFKHVNVVACADLDRARAEARVAAYPGVAVKTLAEILADPAIDLVVNLTTPAGHYPIAKQALEAGKHVLSEKPLALTRDQGRELVQLAAAKNLRLGAAPDTFLGAGIQTCIDLVDQGAIGEPVGAQAFMYSHGTESWHPDPEFFYQAGGGPMFDMGPYYLTTLVALLGPVRRVTGSTRISFPTRTITSEKKKGQVIQVKVPTHVTGILDFASGPIGTITTSFDVWAAEVPRIEIFGSEATLSVPDPNTFGGPVKIRRAGGTDWEEIAVTRPYAGNCRGLGAADLAAALESGRPHRANGALAHHVLDIMLAIHEASDQDRHVDLESQCDRPASLPAALAAGDLD